MTERHNPRHCLYCYQPVQANSTTCLNCHYELALEEKLQAQRELRRARRRYVRAAKDLNTAARTVDRAPYDELGDPI